MNRMITTTTDVLEGWEINQYFAPISSNVVVGANIFSDISASFSDLFGGRAGTYERKLQEIYAQATESLKRKAKAVGANCILGLRIDVGEVSGKGTQMFMVSAVGTPAIAFYTKGLTGNRSNEQAINTVDGELVEKTIKANSLIRRFKENPKAQFSDSALGFIVESEMAFLSPIILTILEGVGFELDSKEKEAKITPYFGGLEPDAASQIIVNHFLDNTVGTGFRNRLINILASYNLIRYDKVLQLLEHNEADVKKVGLELMKYPKETYTRQDIGYMQEVIDLIPRIFSSTRTTEEVKAMFSKNPKEVWICKCGSRNRIDSQYCSSCSNDFQGFKEDEVKPTYILPLLRTRVEVIERLLGI